MSIKNVPCTTGLFRGPALREQDSYCSYVLSFFNMFCNINGLLDFSVSFFWGNSIMPLLFKNKRWKF